MDWAAGMGLDLTEEKEMRRGVVHRHATVAHAAQLQSAWQNSRY